MASIYYRDNNTWIEAINIYEKVNGQWIKKESIENLLEDDIIYIPITALGLLIDEGTDRILIGDDRILV